MYCSVAEFQQSEEHKWQDVRPYNNNMVSILLLLLLLILLLLTTVVIRRSDSLQKSPRYFWQRKWPLKVMGGTQKHYLFSHLFVRRMAGCGDARRGLLFVGITITTITPTTIAIAIATIIGRGQLCVRE